jgi:hypothetical protein
MARSRVVLDVLIQARQEIRLDSVAGVSAEDEPSSRLDEFDLGPSACV